MTVNESGKSCKHKFSPMYVKTIMLKITVSQEGIQVLTFVQ